MNLELCLKCHGYDINKITRIYHGLDHNCRCGCGGNYLEKGSRGFVRAINTLNKPDFKPVMKGTKVYVRDGRVLESEGIEYDSTYINIPYDDLNDKCYCIYFD